MFDKKIILRLSDAYGAAAGVSEKTVSHRVFDDSKKLTALRGKADLTLSRANEALVWFSTHWPTDTPWPDGIARPEMKRTAMQRPEAVAVRAGRAK